MKTKLPNTIKPACSDLSEGENQPDKATARPLLPNCNQNGREIRLGEKVIAKVGTASTNSIEDDAIAALIVQAVNEHAALLVCKLELERALERLSNFAELPQWDMNDEETFEAGKQAVAAYANLAAVRNLEAA